METISVREFLHTLSQPEWRHGNLAAHQYYVSTQVDCEDLAMDDKITISNGLYVDPLGNLMNYLCEPVNIMPDLLHPHREFMISDTNVPFSNTGNNPMTGKLQIPFAECGPGYIDRLPKSRRDRFKGSMKQEQEIKLFQVDHHETSRMSIIKQRAEHFGEDADFYTDFLDLIETPSLHFVAARDSEDPVGTFTLIQSYLNREVWYAYVAFAIQPCIRRAHLKIVEEVLPAGSILHYGAADSLNPDRRKVFEYKQTLCNATLYGPSVAICRPMTPPYYDLSAKCWVLEDTP